MAKRTVKRTLGCLALVILACILIGSGAAGILISLRQSDEPFDDSDMYVTRPEIPEGENAYALLYEATTIVHWDDDENDAVESMIEGIPEQTDFPGRFLQSNLKAVALVRAALDCDQSIWKEYVRAPETSTRKLAVEAVLWALWHEEQRDTDHTRRIEYAFKIIRMGHLQKRSGGPLIEFYRGQRFQNYGIAMLLQVIAEEDPPAELLHHSIAEIEVMQNDSQLIGDALRSEYAHAKAMVDQELGGQNWQFWVYDEQANARALLREYRTLIESADGYYRGAVVPPVRGDAHFMIMVLRGNVLGDIMSKILVPNMENSFKSLAYHRSYNSAVQVLLALKVYHMRHGELPESLDALVPEFFDELPRDWFDGGPIKYNREKALVYCVGPDLKDNGGSDPNEKWTTAEDPSWSISFAKVTHQFSA